MNQCIFCNRSFINKGSLYSHKPFCIGNPDRKIKKNSPNAGRKKGTVAWNKGLKLSDEYKKKISDSLVGKSKGIALTEESELLRRNKIKETISINKLNGGDRIGSGRGIKGWYKGIWCDSTWELAWVIFNIEYENPFTRNNESFVYEFNGKIKKYFPDFKIGDSYIEIKGRRNYNDLDEQTKEKIKQFKGNLIVLMESDMQPYLSYVTKKYGKNFHNLYE
jgi:hypothetical protein